MLFFVPSHFLSLSERLCFRHWSVGWLIYLRVVWLGGRVVIRTWTCDQQVAGSNPSRPTVEFNPGQVVNARASVTKQYNLVPANGWWCLAAGKVTDISGSPPTGLRPWRGI